MDRIELATQLINKGVELLDESAGANGTLGKLIRERYKKIKAENDKYDAETEKKREQYKRAGYGDKGPQKANRELEKSYKDAIEFDNTMKHKVKDKHSEDNPRAYARANPDELYHIYRGGHGWDGTYESAKILQRKRDISDDRLDAKQKALHDRINERAKSQNETVADLLTEAAYLLSLVDNDDE